MNAPILQLHCTICHDETIIDACTDSVPHALFIHRDTICPTCRERIGALVPGYTNTKGLWKGENKTC